MAKCGSGDGAGSVGCWPLKSKVAVWQSHWKPAAWLTSLTVHLLWVQAPLIAYSPSASRQMKLVSRPGRSLFWMVPTATGEVLGSRIRLGRHMGGAAMFPHAGSTAVATASL